MRKRKRLRKNPNLDRVGRAVLKLWRESGGPRTLANLDTIARHYAKVQGLPSGDVYEAAEAAWHTANPKTIRNNPAGVIGPIPGRLLEIRYRRFGPGVGKGMSGLYRHAFKSGSTMLALADGSLLIRPRGRQRLWVNLPH
jgi:hypothetical protein